LQKRSSQTQLRKNFKDEAHLRELSQVVSKPRKLLKGLSSGGGRGGTISGWSSSDRAHHRSELRKDMLKLSFSVRNLAHLRLELRLWTSSLLVVDKQELPKALTSQKLD
jgi:hypothetical protein